MAEYQAQRFSRVMTRPADHARGGYLNLAGRVGSGQEVFGISRDGSGRLGSGQNVFKSRGSEPDFTLTKPGP